MELFCPPSFDVTSKRPLYEDGVLQYLSMDCDDVNEMHVMCGGGDHLKDLPADFSVLFISRLSV